MGTERAAVFVTNSFRDDTRATVRPRIALCPIFVLAHCSTEVNEIPGEIFPCFLLAERKRFSESSRKNYALVILYLRSYNCDEFHKPHSKNIPEALLKEAALDASASLVTTVPTRTESDSMGKIEVPVNVYCGAQTARSLNHFDIG